MEGDSLVHLVVTFDSECQEIISLGLIIFL